MYVCKLINRSCLLNLNPFVVRINVHLISLLLYCLNLDLPLTVFTFQNHSKLGRGL